VLYARAWHNRAVGWADRVTVIRRAGPTGQPVTWGVEQVASCEPSIARIHRDLRGSGVVGSSLLACRPGVTAQRAWQRPRAVAGAVTITSHEDAVRSWHRSDGWTYGNRTSTYHLLREGGESVAYYGWRSRTPNKGFGTLLSLERVRDGWEVRVMGCLDQTGASPHPGGDGAGGQ
jgi:hypothetical protein